MVMEGPDYAAITLSSVVRGTVFLLFHILIASLAAKPEWIAPRAYSQIPDIKHIAPRGLDALKQQETMPPGIQIISAVALSCAHGSQKSKRSRRSF